MRGLNGKAWFYGFRAGLKREENRPWVLAGAACEQWINGELFRVIAEHLRGTRLTVYPEWQGRQHDLAVLRAVPNDPVAWREPIAVVECKVVYLNYSPAKRGAYIERVFEQLAAPHSRNPQRVGFLVGVYAFWPDYRRRPPRETFKEFRESLGRGFRKCVERGIKGFSTRVDHGGAMETLIDETDASIGGARVTVGCVAQYVRLLPA